MSGKNDGVKHKMPFSIPKFARRSRRLKGALETPDLIVVGLGNPEPHYLNTRHNAGWWLVDALAERHRIEILRAHSTARLGVGKARLDDGGGERRVIALAKPRTHVNGSGEAVRYLLARFGVPQERLLVVYDEAALPPGKLRLRPKGGAAGHNGVKSIISALGGSRDFARLRIGIGKPEPGGDMVGWALGEPSPEDRELIDAAIAKGADAVLTVLNEGVETAMNRFN